MKNIIFMISIQQDERSKNQAHYWSIKSWSDYAKKHDIDLYVLNESIYYPHQWNKSLVYKFLASSEIDADRVLYVDADTIVHPDAPNIFDVFPKGKFYGVRNFGSMDWVIRSIELYSLVFNNHELDWEKYINTGVMLFDKSHIPLFDRMCDLQDNESDMLRNAETYGVGKDQPVINYLLDMMNIPRGYMGYEWNMQDMMRSECIGQDMINTKYGYVYHYNCGIKPTPAHWMKYTYSFLNEK